MVLHKTVYVNIVFPSISLPPKENKRDPDDISKAGLRFHLYQWISCVLPEVTKATTSKFLHKLKSQKL